MIFVTVGTHEQQFNRLLKEVDRLKKDGIIQDEVFIQTGYSTYEPKYCKWKKLLSFDEMNEMYEKADIIITHGGPASFMKALELKKIPIVVPRQVKYDEHVNDHQVEFTKFVEDRLGNIIGIYETNNMVQIISNYDNKVKQMNREIAINNEEFNRRLNDKLTKLFK